MKVDLGSKYLEIKNNWRRLVFTLTVGLVGCLIAVYLNFPLPWLLGALFTTTIAALMGHNLWMPAWLRIISHLVLGALFGTSVSPDFLNNVSKWIPSIIAVITYVVLVMPPVMLYLIKVMKVDIITAYFSAAPGGLIPMTSIGQSMGADAKIISLVQSSRIIMTVLIVPFAFAIYGGYEPSGNVGSGGSFATLSPLDGLALLGIAICGCLLARPLKIPNPELMGPMIAISVFTMTGVFSAEVPESLVAIAQWIIGSSIGVMFNNVKPRLVTGTLFHGSLLSAFMISFAAGVALITHQITSIPTNGLILAFAPGGFTEMALVGFALGIDIAFLVTHQLTRYFFVILMLPIIYKKLKI